MCKKHLIVCAAVLLVSCTSTQLETTKKVVKQASKATLPFIATITSAYGSPYAAVIEAFTEAVVPDYIAPANDEDYADDDCYESDEDSEFCSGYEEDDEYDEDNSDEYSSESEGDIDSENEVETLLAQVDIVREVAVGGVSRAESIRNGDTLTAEDNYKVQVGCNTECYAYIAQLDATGKMDPILPGPFVSVSNPLPANTLISFPGKDAWFYLDNNVGVEQLYFIISRTPRSDIELIFKQLSKANENLTQLKAVSMEKPTILTKGIGGVRRDKQQPVVLPSGNSDTYLSTLLKSVDAELVLTRWFNHQ